MFRFLLLLILSISSVIGQVNIEGLRNPELNRTNFSVEIDSDIATQSNKDNWEITSELRFDKLFDNQSSILVVVEGEYSEQTVDSIKDVQENKGFVHTRYVVPLQSYELETFGQIELDNFRSILNRNLLGMGLRFTAQSTKVDNLNYGIGMMYEHEKYDRSSILKSDSIKSTNYITLNKQLSSNWFVSTTSYLQFDISDLQVYRILNITEFALNATDEIDIAFNFDSKFDAKPVLDDLSKSFFDFAIGIRYNFSLVLKRSSSNLGNCPVPVNDSEFAIKGT